MKFLGLIVLIYSLVAISGLLFVGLMMGFFAIKKKISKMDEEKWDLYFKGITNSGYLLRFGALYFVALCFAVSIGYVAFGAFNFKNPVFLCGVTFIYGALKITWKLTRNKDKLIEKVNKISNRGINMLPNSDYLLSALDLDMPPIGFYDVEDTQTFEPVVKPKRCIFGAYENWKNGESVCLSKGNGTCRGGGYWIGNDEFTTRNKFANTLFEREGFKASPEIMEEWLIAQKPYEIKNNYVVISKLKDDFYEDLQTVTFFVTIDQLTLLLIGADYHKGAPNSGSVKNFFGSGCCQMAAVFNDCPENVPQAFIGGTDIAMREHLPANIIAFTVNKAMYEQLCSLDENSFLNKAFLRRLKTVRAEQV